MGKTKTCVHAQSHQVGPERPFFGPVTIDDQNQAAHGNITITVECDGCGAQQEQNINGRHVERSGWDAPRKEERA